MTSFGIVIFRDIKEFYTGSCFLSDAYCGVTFFGDQID